MNVSIVWVWKAGRLQQPRSPLSSHQSFPLEKLQVFFFPLRCNLIPPPPPSPKSLSNISDTQTYLFCSGHDSLIWVTIPENSALAWFIPTKSRCCVCVCLFTTSCNEPGTPAQQSLASHTVGSHPQNLVWLSSQVIYRQIISSAG